MNGRCSPLTATVTLTDRRPDGATGTASIGAADPVFAGHYPGFPVLPGVYLLELVDRVVRGSLDEDTDLRLSAVDRCRFSNPVYPRDEVTVRTVLLRDETGVRCTAWVSTARGPVAEMRVRYEPAVDR